MRRVLSIDIGMKNFVFCDLEVESGRIVEWARLSLPPKGKGGPPRRPQQALGGYLVV